MTVGGAGRGRRVAAALLLVLLAAACTPAERPPPRPATSWQRVDPGGATRCARGGRYAFWVRVADPNRLVVFFQGGGGCFDQRSCAVGSTWFDDAVTDADNPTHAGGMLSLTDPRNPFQRWSWVFIPSCGGDVHLGDRRVRYGSVAVQQRGWRNAHAAIDWAFAHVPNVDTVLVAGCSAGSVGSAFHVPAILDHWPRARVAQVGDSLAFVFHRPVNLADWGAPAHFPAFFRVGDRPFTMVAYLTALAHRYPRLVVARFNHAGDDVQERFYRGVGGDPAEFEGRLRAAEAALGRLANYRSYLACGDAHCSFGNQAFYTTRVNGVVLRDWVADLAAGRDVACPLCPG